MPRRQLTQAERRLWAEVARSIAPLKGHLPPAEPAAAAPASVPDAVPPRQPPPAAGAHPARPVLPSLAPMERRTARALARGRRRPDASIDLHGLDQAAAHAALLRFLHRCQQEGHSLVQVVTGKGRAGDPSGERGVLRRLAPLWLTAPELRRVVLGLDEAGPRQGGAGALHVRLRRARIS